MKRLSTQKLLVLLVALIFSIGVLILCIHKINLNREDNSFIAPETMNIDYINRIYSGPITFTELIYSEKIEEGYLCLLNTSSNDINFVYLEMKKDGVRYSVKSRAAIDVKTLGADYTLYETITPINSLYEDVKYCFSIFSNPQIDVVSVCNESIPIFKFNLIIDGVLSEYGFWVAKLSPGERIIVE